MMRFLVQDSQQDILEQFNQNNVHIAWFDVSYRGCQFGISSFTCPIEPLHLLENGMIPDCLTILFKDKMHVLQTAELNSIAPH
jgi:hypothetical protein